MLQANVLQTVLLKLLTGLLALARVSLSSPSLLEASLVVLKAADGAPRADGARHAVGHAATSGTGFNDLSTDTHTQAHGNVRNVGHVQDLRAVGKRESPQLRGGAEQVDVAGLRGRRVHLGLSK